jgi:hypothetical protein
VVVFVVVVVAAVAVVSPMTSLAVSSYPSFSRSPELKRRLSADTFVENEDLKLENWNLFAMRRLKWW